MPRPPKMFDFIYVFTYTPKFNSQSFKFLSLHKKSATLKSFVTEIICMYKYNVRIVYLD